MKLTETNRAEKYLRYLLLLILIAYLTVFSIINFSGFARFCNGDMYADTILAKHMWDQKTLFPDNWTFGNQYYVIATPVLSALFYGITGSVNLGMALATTVMTLLLLLSMAWMLRPFADKTRILCALVAMLGCILCISMEKIEGQIFYLMASYYSCYLITIFVVWGDYVRAALIKPKRRRYGMLVLSLLLSFATGMQSLRQTVIMVLPLLAFEFFRLAKSVLKSKRFPDRENILTALRVVAVTAANIAGAVLIRILDIRNVSIYGDIKPVSLEMMIENAKVCLRGLCSITGIGYAEIYEPGWFVALFSCASIAVVVLGLLKQLFSKKAEKDGIAWYIFLCVFSLLTLLAVTVLTEVELRGIYLFIWYPLICFSFLKLMQGWRQRFRRALIIVLCIFMAANIFVSYGKPAEQSLDDNTTVYEEMADWTVENGYSIVYGHWWRAAPVAAAADGKAILGGWFSDTYEILPYLNTLDVYTEEDNKNAVYCIASSDFEQALEKATQRGAGLTLLAEFDGGNFGLYSSSVQLMYFG